MLWQSFVGAAVLALLLQVALRGGLRASHAPSQMSTRISRIILATGALISLLPVILLALDTAAARSPSDAAGQLTGLVIALGIMLPPWIWLTVLARSSQTRGRQTIVFAAGTACALLAAAVYARAYMRPTDAQSGISVIVVPFMQLVVIFVAVLAEVALG